MLCLSVWIAVKHALSCVRNDIRPRLNLPATGEEILRRLTELNEDSEYHRTKYYSAVESEVSLVVQPPSNTETKPTE